MVDGWECFAYIEYKFSHLQLLIFIKTKIRSFSSVDKFQYTTIKSLYQFNVTNNFLYILVFMDNCTIDCIEIFGNFSQEATCQFVQDNCVQDTIQVIQGYYCLVNSSLMILAIVSVLTNRSRSWSFSSSITRSTSPLTSSLLLASKTSLSSWVIHWLKKICPKPSLVLHF